MKKIGVVTFQRAVNYGAVLQAYALQTIITEMGAEVEFINYYSSAVEDIYMPGKVLHGRSLKSVIKAIVEFRDKRKKRKAFLRFTDKYLYNSIFIKNKEELKAINDSYDAFITGSDQVWNDICTGMDPFFFLDFADNRKKNSYAASFAFEHIPEQLTETYNNLLYEYQNISVREEQGRVIIKDLLDRSVEVHVDPTLLLNSEQWDTAAEDVQGLGDYICVYTVQPPKNLLNVARELAESTGMRIVYINGNSAMKMKYHDFTFISDASPSEFVGLFRNAKYVLTNSFHGTVFSIIYHKKFITECQTKEKYNSRAENLLNLLGLSESILKKHGSYKDILNINTEWAAVEECLREQKNKSRAYLSKIIK